MSDSSTNPSDPQMQQALRVAIAATERGDFAGAMKVFRAVYGDPNLKAPPDGLSAYGLCVAMEEKQTKKGIDLCRAAIAAQFYDARHYCNLITLHLKKANRKSAIDVLEEGLGRLPSDAALLALRDKLAVPKPPPIPFLSRENLLNRVLTRGKRASSGRVRHKSRSGIHFGNISPLVAGLIVLLFFAAVFGTTYVILYRQAYK